MFNIPNSANSLPNSTFYTSGSKAELFNFTGATGSTSFTSAVPFTQQQIHHVTPREKRKSESSHLIPDLEEEVPPRKLYISEAAMSNHFARMNLTHPWNASVNHAPRTSSSSLATFANLSAEIESNANTAESVEVLPDVKESESEEVTETPLLKLTDDLKKHLREYPSEGPIEDVIRKIANPKPSLAIVPFDPNFVPPTFRQKESSKVDSSTDSPACDRSLTSMEVEPITPSSATSANDISTDNEFVPTTQLEACRPVPCTTPFWYPVPATGSPNSVSCFGPRNMFSYPISNSSDHGVVLDQTTQFIQPCKPHGPIFPPF